MNEVTSRGPRLDAGGLTRTLDWLYAANRRAEARGVRPTPICVWGMHGIGKTMLVEELAKRKGWKFAYCAPAQFEEMGDLHGLPVLGEAADGTRETQFAPPSWVPREPGPGILLLDDLNRADDRILRGLMQLLQRYGMMSWSLPPDWQIVATANPEGGDYSVTPMDDAMLDRFIHLGLGFDARAWARWANGASVDQRGISFVLTYPEVVSGPKTTPRALVRFFDLIAEIPDLRGEIELVRTLGLAALDETTVASFVAFVNDGLIELLEPADVLDAEDERALARRVDTIARDGDLVRVDRLSIVGMRLLLAVTRKDYVPGPLHAANLVRFLLHPVIPNDLRLSLHRDLVAEGGPRVAAMLRDPQLAKRILGGM
jgi:MoxR-like ATPase